MSKKHSRDESEEYYLKLSTEELEEILTEKELSFSCAFIRCFNKAEAARRSGYSVIAARQEGYRLFTKHYIRAYIEKIKDDISGQLKISKMSLLEKHANIVNSSISDIYTDWGKIKPFKDIPEWALETIKSIHTETKSVKSGKDEKIEVRNVNIELHNSQISNDAILKALGWQGSDTVKQVNYNIELSKEESKNINDILEDKY